MDKVSSLDWSLVQAFLAVADQGSLSGAARQLRASQPTIGRQIAALETQLGVSLFQREPRGMALTEAGRALRNPAEDMRAAAAKLNLAAAGEAGAQGGSVRLTASIFISHWVLPPLMAQLRRRAPEITLDLVATDTTENLLFHEADIAIRMYRPTQLDMVTRHICDVPLGMFAAKSYLEQHGVPTDGEALLQHDVVGYDTSELIVAGMRAHSIDVTRDFFKVRCDNQSAYWQLVRSGCGIGFCQQATGRADPLVEELDLGLSIPPLPVWLTTHERLRHSPPVARVWDFLTSNLPPLLDPR